jgi:hypothetical protein
MEQIVENAEGGVQSFVAFEGSKDRPRGQSLVRVRVVNPKCNGLSVGKNFVPRGTHELLLYPDELVAAKKHLLETNAAAVEAAQKTYEMNVATDAAALIGCTGSIEDLLAAHQRGQSFERWDAQAVKDAFAKARATSAHSLEASFHAVNKRAIKPLTEIVELDKGIPEPQREKQVDEQNASAAIVAKATADAVAATMGPALKAIADGQLALAEALKAMGKK